jgi:RNA polymerase sigma-70 factor (ECF subfamily)
MTDSEFRDAFEQHKDVLYRFAYRMTGSSSTAEDVVQECFLTLWRKPSTYRSNRGALRAFLLGITRNLIFRRWRYQHQCRSLDEEDSAYLPIDIVSSERDGAVAKAVQALPPLQREALILAEYEEMSLEQIASTTEAEIAAVKSRLYRARENLRRILAPWLESKGALHGTKR